MSVKIHFQRDMERLKKLLLTLGAMVEEAMNKAVTALLDRKAGLAAEVINGDGEIDNKEIEVEDECLKILALHQPVAGDLRYIVAVLKVNGYLERIGDLAVNIAERATLLSDHALLAVPHDFRKMAAFVQAMVRDSLDALISRDTGLARSVCERDDEVDRMNAEVYRVLQEQMKSDPEIIIRGVNKLSVSYQLERIADHATNIAEDVVFMVEGAIIRHHFDTRKKEDLE